MPSDFEDPLYWRKRFQSETAFDWLTTSSTFIHILTPYLERLDPQTSEMLHLGSGTSDLHNHLRRRGFLNVTNVDYEPLALERGRQLESKAFGDVKTRYRVADVTKLEPPSDSAPKCQLVIDKSTADAVSCGGDEAVIAMAERIHGCLDKESGVWISMSYSDSRFDVERVKELFDVGVISTVPIPKRLESDPDISHWCYSLSPKEA